MSASKIKDNKKLERGICDVVNGLISNNLDYHERALKAEE
jgi:hypothetical protein